MTHQVFISHASEDKPFAEELRKALQDHGVTSWIDHRELTAGGELEQEIQDAIREAKVCLTVWTLHALNSDWVDKETLWAMGEKEKREDYKFIPLLLGEGIKPAAIKKILRRELKCLTVRDEAAGLQEAMAALLAALGKRLPSMPAARELLPPPPMEELLLVLSHPAWVEKDGKRRGEAEAELEYHPADGQRGVESPPFRLVSPLGPIEANALSWYLERFPRWPGEAFRPRARQIEGQIPEWGKALYAQVMERPEVRNVRQRWENVGGTHPRRFTVRVKSASTTEASQAAAHLLSLPWEILHDGRRFLFQGQPPVRVRRRLPNANYAPPFDTRPPLRVLLLSPRPEDETAGFIDHRVIAQPVVQALGELGDLVQLTVLADPSLAGSVKALAEAKKQGTPFHVVHFDGHGVYLQEQGLGALCFEKGGQASTLQNRATDVVDGPRLAAELTDYRIPLFFLNACQSAQVGRDPTSSVAAQLLDRGVAAVAAMSHSVLVRHPGWVGGGRTLVSMQK